MWWEADGHLEVRNNRLFIAGVEATKLASKYGTPLFVYNGNRVIDNFSRLKNAFASFGVVPRIHYSVKANSHLAILGLLLKQGSWVDAVSPNEARLALKAGFPRQRILFTGTSVSNSDLKQLIQMGVRVNIDSFSQMQRMADLGFRGEASIRWNPGRGAGHHGHTITAGKFIKFGIPEERIAEAFSKARELGLNIVGLHQHIGSGWLGKDVNVFLQMVGKTIEVAERAAEILGKSLEFVDFGGGPGIPYSASQEQFPVKEYARGILEKMRARNLKAEIAIEPGRYIVGDAGILLVEVNTVEEKNIPIIGVDSGFNHLIRPAFYGSHHEIVLCNNVGGRGRGRFMVAGNLCESGDVFNESKEELRELPLPEEGDTLAILNAGAYGYVMASNYNSRAKPACVLLLGGKDRLIARRESFDDLVRLEKPA
jgi:diaminopimelate decarboxylase